MELQQLRYFRTAAQMENISRAARYHRIPQPSMSKIISALERELGMPLFEREGNRLHLNQQGRLFLREVDKALLTIDGALSDLSDISHGLCFWCWKTAGSSPNAPPPFCGAIPT